LNEYGSLALALSLVSMAYHSKPLWKLLLATAAGPDELLTCADCFAILEYLAEAESASENQHKLFQSARQHLAACPDCQEYYLRRLEELEFSQKQGKATIDSHPR
jgi:hypothetical protein